MDKKRKIQLILLALLVVSATAIVLRFRYQADVEPTQFRNLSGFIYSEANSQAIPGATVTLSSSDSAFTPITTQTAVGSTGAYYFRYSTDQKYDHISVAKDSFYTIDGYFQEPEDSTNLNQTINIPLKPGTGTQNLAIYSISASPNVAFSLSFPFPLTNPDPFKLTAMPQTLAQAAKPLTLPATATYFYNLNPQTNAVYLVDSTMPLEQGKTYYINSKGGLTFLVKGQPSSTDTSLTPTSTTIPTYFGNPFQTPINSADIQLVSLGDSSLVYSLPEAVKIGYVTDSLLSDPTLTIPTTIIPPKIFPPSPAIPTPTPTPTPQSLDFNNIISHVKAADTTPVTFKISANPTLLPSHAYGITVKKAGFKLRFGKNINGHITDHTTGNPLTGVTITLTQSSIGLNPNDTDSTNDQVISQTDSSGSYSLLAPNPYLDKLVLEKTGYNTIVANLSNNISLSQILSNFTLTPGSDVESFQAISAKANQTFNFGLSITPIANSGVTTIVKSGNQNIEKNVNNQISVFDPAKQTFVPLTSDLLKPGYVYNITPTQDSTLLIKEDLSEPVADPNQAEPTPAPDPNPPFLVSHSGSQYYIASASDAEPLSHYMITWNGLEFDLSQAATQGLIQPTITIDSKAINLSKTKQTDLGNLYLEAGAVLTFTDKADLTFSRDNDDLQPSYDNGYKLLPILSKAFQDAGINIGETENILEALNSCYPSYFDRRATDDTRNACLNSLNFEDSISNAPTPTPGVLSGLFSRLGLSTKHTQAATASQKKGTIKDKTVWQVTKGVGYDATWCSHDSTGCPSNHAMLGTGVAGRTLPPVPKTPSEIWSEYYLNTQTTNKKNWWDANGPPVNYRGSSINAYSNNFYSKAFWGSDSNFGMGVNLQKQHYSYHDKYQSLQKTKDQWENFVDTSPMLIDLYYRYPSVFTDANRYKLEFTEQERKVLKTVFNAGLYKIKTPSAGLQDETFDVFINLTFAAQGAKLAGAVGKLGVQYVAGKIGAREASAMLEDLPIVLKDPLKKTNPIMIGQALKGQFSKKTVDLATPNLAKLAGRDAFFITSRSYKSLAPKMIIRNAAAIEKGAQAYAEALDSLPKLPIWPQAVEASGMSEKAFANKLMMTTDQFTMGGSRSLPEGCLGLSMQCGYVEVHTGLAVLENDTYLYNTIFHEIGHLVPNGPLYEKYLLDYGIKLPDGNRYSLMNEIYSSAFADLGRNSPGLGSDFWNYKVEKNLWNSLINAEGRIYNLSDRDASIKLLQDFTQKGFRQGLDDNFGVAAEKVNGVAQNGSFHDYMNESFMKWKTKGDPHDLSQVLIKLIRMH